MSIMKRTALLIAAAMLLTAGHALADEALTTPTDLIADPVPVVETIPEEQASIVGEVIELEEFKPFSYGYAYIKGGAMIYPGADCRKGAVAVNEERAAVFVIARSPMNTFRVQYVQDKELRTGWVAGNDIVPMTDEQADSYAAANRGAAGAIRCSEGQPLLPLKLQDLTSPAVTIDPEEVTEEPAAEEVTEEPAAEEVTEEPAPAKKPEAPKAKEPQNEAKPSSFSTDLTTDETYTVHVYIDPQSVPAYGGTVKLVALVEGEIGEAAYQWQCKAADGEWTNIDHAEESTYAFILTNETCALQYRVAVVDAAKGE